VPGDDEDYRCEPGLMAEVFGPQVDIIIDAGRGQLMPSTIVDCTSGEPSVIRQGKGKLVV
jgi:tRNA A37 threonylcarbamoyladenosine synthetase subunit TsaC/SUA5/YrdC